MRTLLLGLLFLGWAGCIAFLRAYRVWLLYYLLGAVGCAYWLVLVGREWLQLETVLAYTVAWSVHLVTGWLGIPTQIFDRAPGVLLVLVVVQEVGWTALRIGVESSGLLEISVLVGLLLFYPGWSLTRRVQSILIGVAATWLANVLRVLVIALILHEFGKESLILAHTFIGKTLFFALTIAIYWYLITRPTLADVRARLKRSQ